MPYLAAAYSVLCLVSLGLIASMVWRNRRLRAELQALSQAVEEDRPQ